MTPDRRHRAATVAVLAAAAPAGLSIGALVGGSDEQARGARPAAAVAPPSRTIELVAAGDLTFGRDGAPAPGGARAVLAGVSRDLRGDVVLGNLETVLGDVAAGGPLGMGDKCVRAAESCFAFRAPASTARGLRRSGFTMLNVANNHAADYGATGELTTVRALYDAGLRWTGRPGQIMVVPAGGLRVAVVGFAPYPWAQSLLDLAAAQGLIRAAAARADVVVATMHAGAEGPGARHVRPGMERYLGEDRGDPIAFAHAAIDAGADVVVGHGPHVLRAMEWYRGRLIAYSLGNLSGHRTVSVAGDLATSAILRLTLRADGAFVRGRLVPVRLTGTGTPAVDRAHRAWSLVRRLSREDLGASALRRDGSVVPPTAAGRRTTPR